MPPLRLFQMVTARWYNACAEYAVRLAAGLAHRGHDVTLVGYPDSPPIRAARGLGLPVWEELDLRPGRLDAPAMAFRLALALRRRHVDLVDAHRAEDHLFAALAQAAVPRVRVVRTRGDVRPPRRHPLNRLLYERRTDGHILAAEFMRERFYAGFEIPPSRLAVIPPAIDLAAYRHGVPTMAAAREALGLEKESLLVGLIGRWTAAKGIPVAIEAFGRVASTHPKVRFVVTGEPYDISRETLLALIAAAGLTGRVDLFPRLADVRQLMAALDAGVIASTASEAICRVAVEYLALGIPVVGTNVNSIPEIVRHDRAGVIVPPGNPVAMAEALTSLLVDPRRRAALAAGARAEADARFDLGRQLDATEAFYQRVRESPR